MLEHVTEPIHCHCTTVATSESAIKYSIFNKSFFCAARTVHSHCLVKYTFSCILPEYFLIKKPSSMTVRWLPLSVARVPTWVQPTVTFPISDHVNVLRDYKKKGPSHILKLNTCHCHLLTDMLIEFSQSLILLTNLKCLNVPYPSILFYQFLL